MIDRRKIRVSLFVLVVGCYIAACTPPVRGVETAAPVVLQNTPTQVPLEQEATGAADPTASATPAPQTSPPASEASIWVIGDWVQSDQWPLANQIRTMFFSTAGELWTGGPGGIVRWDVRTGQRSIFHTRTDSIQYVIESITQSDDGMIWISTFGRGLIRIDSSAEWKLFTSENGLPTNSISILLPDQNGRILANPSRFAQEPYVFEGSTGYFDGKQWVSLVEGKGGFSLLALAPDGSIWAADLEPDYATNTVLRYSGSIWERIRIDAGPIQKNITALTVAPDGGVWLASHEAVYVYKQDQWTEIIPPWTTQPSVYVTAIEITSDNDVWFGLSSLAGVLGEKCGDFWADAVEMGVFRYKNQESTQFTKDNGLIDNKVCDIALDQEGNVWVGTYNKGISRFDGVSWTSFVVP